MSAAAPIIKERSHTLRDRVDVAADCGQNAWAAAAIEEMDVLVEIMRVLAREAHEQPSPGTHTDSGELVGRLRLTLELVEAAYVDVNAIRAALLTTIGWLEGRP